MNATSVVVKHFVIASDRSYEAVREALNEQLGKQADWKKIAQEMKTTNPEWKQISKIITRQMGPSGFAVFSKIEFGPLLALKGSPAKAVQYLIGNPLLALMMIERVPEAALYAPLKLVLYEDPAGSVFIAYDSFASQLDQYPDPAIAPVAHLVEKKLGEMIVKVATG
ncbi:DUF302 domain-containing protein [Methanoregula sp.]|uniref:DUF302 domain-containing protein n=1 Tax=Methanoregula sp. TaxID=2052170 RepID=UPI003BAE9DA3